MILRDAHTRSPLEGRPFDFPLREDSGVTQTAVLALSISTAIAWFVTGCLPAFPERCVSHAECAPLLCVEGRCVGAADAEASREDASDSDSSSNEGPADEPFDAMVGPSDGALGDASTSTVAADAGPDGGLCGRCTPQGWSPILRNIRSSTASPEPCPTGWMPFGAAPVVYGGLTVPSPGCTSCACGPPNGVTCDVESQSCTGDALDQSCSNSVSMSPIARGDGACVTFSVDYICSYALATASRAIGGSCSESGGALMPFTWASAHDLCEPSVRGACSDSMCVPPPGGTYLPTLCVARSGDLGCPAGFPTRTLVHRGATDERSCAACTCGSPKGASCAATVTFYACPDCMGASLEVPVSGACTPAGNGINCGGGASLRSARYTGAVSPGRCTPSAASESGTVTPTEPWTVCCPS